jgi:lipid-binding SYLF domain-containing protein
LGLWLAGNIGCAAEHPPAHKTPASGAPDSPAAKIIDVGEAHTDKFLNFTQTEGLRNMLGGTRGIFIAPNTGGGALIAGLNTGTGFLMRRHGQEWSDPIFFDITETSAGLQLGLKKSNVIVLLLTDTAVNNFISGSMRLGGSGGITLGAYGMSVSGAGGLDGGLELLIISATQGVSLGGGVATVQPKLDKALNAQAYGPDADAKAILATPGGKYAPAQRLREDLTRMVVQAWGIGAVAVQVTSETRP